MARGRKPKAPKVEEVFKPDFDLAVKIYREDIRPAQAKVGEFAQEQSTGYKELKKRAHVNPEAARLAFRLDKMEPAKRDDYWRTLVGLTEVLGIGPTEDLVDAAEGKTNASFIPSGSSQRPELMSVN